MTPDDELDHILMSTEQDILPSAGFTRSVMEAVQREAFAPQPIPFPWKRALPGMAGAALALLWILVASLRQLASGGTAPPLEITLPAQAIPILEASAWTIGGVLLAYVSVKLSMRIVRA